MDKYFVFYDDDYPENAGIGIKEFISEVEACEFIERRIAQEPRKRDLNCYTLINGGIIKLLEYQSVTKVKTEK